MFFMFLMSNTLSTYVLKLTTANNTAEEIRTKLQKAKAKGKGI